MSKQQPTININPLSCIPLRLIMNFKQTEGGTGTGFVYNHNGRDYLITNWHNVTGRHNQDKSHLHSKHLIPDNIKVWFHASELGSWGSAILPLYTDSDNQNPGWLVHPTFGEQVDVIAIPINVKIDGATLYPITDQPNYTDAPLRVATDVFILGYPKGLSGGLNFPIWKRGTIASEPEIDLNDLPLLFIDSATRSGMSGSPVIWTSQGDSFTNTDGAMVTTSRAVTSRIGVYSGRTSATSQEAQIGYIWKDRVIAEIIDGGVFDPVSSFNL